MDLKSVKKEKTLSQKAYEIIKDAIVHNKIEPGTLLAEEPLSKQLSISRTPIRSALQQLVFEGFAKIDSTKHIFVSDITEEDIQDVSIIRCDLETLCIKLLKLPLSPNCITELNSINEKQSKIILDKNPDYVSFSYLDYDFHSYIAQLTGNEYLIEFVSKLNKITNRFLLISGTLDKYCKTALEEHRLIISFLEKEQKDYAVLAMRDHIIKASKRILIK